MNKDKLLIILIPIGIIITSIVIIIMILIGYAFINTLTYPGFTDDMIVNKVDSPDSNHYAKIYYRTFGATAPNVILISICDTNNKCKVIYYNKEKEGDLTIEYSNDDSYVITNTAFKWIDNETIEFNTYTLNIYKDKYDFRRNS